jgi:hypothetical protein
MQNPETERLLRRIEELERRVGSLEAAAPRRDWRKVAGIMGEMTEFDRQWMEECRRIREADRRETAWR